MLGDARRHLDGDDLLRAFNDLRDQIDFAVGGVTRDDVANGSIDPSKLSRQQRAALAIDGEVPGAFSLSNPWSPKVDFSEQTTRAAEAQAGLVIVLSAEASVLSTALDAVTAPRFAFLWDDEKIAATGTLKLDFTNKTILVVDVGPPKGQRLSLWCTDDAVEFHPIKEGAPSELEQIRREVFGALKPDTGFLDGIKHAFDSVIDVEKGAGIALAIVGGIVLYLMFKSETSLMGGGNG